MIKLIIELLQSDEWLNTQSEAIELAKGKNELVNNWGAAKRKLKRVWQNKK